MTIWILFFFNLSYLAFYLCVYLYNTINIIKNRFWLRHTVIGKMMIPKSVGSCFNDINNHNHDYFIQIRTSFEKLTCGQQVINISICARRIFVAYQLHIHVWICVLIFKVLVTKLVPKFPRSVTPNLHFCLVWGANNC